MLALLRLIASRFSYAGARDERRNRSEHGPFISMLERDLNNVALLARALVEHRL